MSMVRGQLISASRSGLGDLGRRRRTWLLIGGALLLAAALIGSAARPMAAGAAREGDHQASGAGRTIIEGGGPAGQPVVTVLGFHANGQGGDFECLALVPPAAASFSAESGDFEVNAMYVTGKVTSLQVNAGTAVLKGTATITGIGAGTNVPFTFAVRAGGPGTTATLDVPGFTFHEILLEGQVKID
jgi:hypothetical protein